MTPLPITRELLRSLKLPVPEGGSKDERGRVLVVAGSRSVPGAALLAGNAALRVGAGRLRVATAEAVALPLALALPEAFVLALGDTEAGGFTDPGLHKLAPSLERCDAVLVGPGMTDEDATAELTAAIVRSHGDAAMVLDAAAMVRLCSDAQFAGVCAGQAILTPHAGEMAQMLGLGRDAVEADPVEAARTAARQFQTTVIMKGAATFVASPDGKLWRYDGGCTGLGTSGSGDVLAGLLVGLLARGAPSNEAACWGVYLHGEAGSRLAHRIGPLGFLARELAAEVPAILRETAGG